MRLRLIALKLLALLLAWLLPGLALAQLVIDVDPSKFRKYPVAVTELKNFGEAADALGLAKQGQDILMNDLDIAGIFEVLNPKSFLEDVKTSGITEATINFTQWLQVGADGLVKGGFWATGDKVKLDLRLFDVAKGREVLKKTYEGEAKQFRRFIHSYADEIVKFLTKEDGIFSTRIVGVRNLNQRKQVVTMDFDGQNLEVVVDNSSINLLPAWSRDGAMIYFTSYINNNPDLFKIPAGGGKMLKVSDYRGLNVGAALAPDGNRLALTLSKDGNSEIYLMNTDGANLVRATHSFAIDTSPTWSPDRQRLAFVSDRSGTPQIYVKRVSEGEAARLTFQGDYNQSPAWSPKGDRIAFCARDERLVYDIFLVNPDTKEITRLTQDQGNNEDPSWAPDGRHLVFSSTRSGEAKLYIMNADGTNQRKITNGPGVYTTPDWSNRLKGGK